MSVVHQFGLNDVSFVKAPKGLEEVWLATVSAPHGDGIVSGLLWKGQTIQIKVQFGEGKFTGEVADVADIWDGSEGHIATKERMGLPAAIAISDVFSGPDEMLWMSVLGSEDDDYPAHVLRLDAEKHKVVSKTKMGESIRRMRFFQKGRHLVLIRGDDTIEFYQPEAFIQKKR